MLAMKSATATRSTTNVARPLAAEDVRRGDYVSVLSEIFELPSFLWTSDAQLLPPDQLVRIECRGSEGGLPLKVKAICLPYIFVKKPCGGHKTLDVRQHRLVRLCPEYARLVCGVLRKKSVVVPSF
jgi:hypothetical protein